MQNRNESQLRVLVLDSTRMGTQLLCDVLGRDRRFVPFPAESLESATSGNFDVALIAETAQLNSFSGSGLIQELRRRRPELPVIVLLEESTREAVVGAVRSGGRGVLCRSESIKVLGKCIACVRSGQFWANQNEIEYLLEALSDPVPIRIVDAKGAALLSVREQDVVRWVAEGLTNREIADRLELSEHTIKNYLFRIFEKLGISNRMELILYVVSQIAPHRAASTPSNGKNGRHSEQSRQENAGPREAYILAERYRTGEGVSRDPVCAYMWFDIAKSASRMITQQAEEAVVELTTTMSPAQIQAAKQRAKEFLARVQEGSPVRQGDVDIPSSHVA